MSDETLNPSSQTGHSLGFLSSMFSSVTLPGFSFWESQTQTQKKKEKKRCFTKNTKGEKTLKKRRNGAVSNTGHTETSQPVCPHGGEVPRHKAKILPVLLSFCCLGFSSAKDSLFASPQFPSNALPSLRGAAHGQTTMLLHTYVESVCVEVGVGG